VEGRNKAFCINFYGALVHFSTQLSKNIHRVNKQKIFISRCHNFAPLMRDRRKINNTNHLTMTSPSSSSTEDSSDDSQQAPLMPVRKKGAPEHQTTLKRKAKTKAMAAANKASSNKKRKLPTSSKKKAAMAKKRKAAPSPVEEKKAKKKREPNYTDVEDLSLCKAYANVSTDPVHGTHQKGSTFWNAIKEKYDIFLPEVNKEQEVEMVNLPERNCDSLEQRYNKTIKKIMHKWNGYYKKAKSPLKSGWTEDMYREHACQLYNIAEGKPFKLEHCVDTLFQLPKFMPVLGDNGWSDEIDDSVVDTSQGGEEDEESSKKPPARVNNIGSAMGDNMSRPMGAKKAKLILEKESRSSKASRHGDSMIASAQILADQTGRLAAAMEKKQKVDSLWKLMDFYIRVGRNDDAYRITQQIEAIELGNFPPEATPHALGQAVPSPPPVATMPTMPTAMPPIPGFPGHDIPTQLPTNDILVPTGASAVDAASSPTTATAATLPLLKNRRQLMMIIVKLVMLIAGLGMDAERMNSLIRIQLAFS
jgi:hypothetical protein